jgi:hypothetical protein
MTLEIRRADPTGVPPDDNPATAVPLAIPDRTLIVVGAKMFSSSDVGFVSPSDQRRRVGQRSNGRFGTTWRNEPSHGTTVTIPFGGTSLQEEVVKKMDQFVKDQLGDLIFRKYIIVYESAAPATRFSPDDMRNYT